MHSCTHLQVDRPYIMLNSATYISFSHQKLRMCKSIGYEFYCEEHFVVKHKSKYNCENAIFFNLGSEILKKIVILHIISIKLTSSLQDLMEGMKLF